MSVSVKICGLRTPEQIATAADAGARYVGFVFFEKSPRHLTVEAAQALAVDVPPGMAKVALTVDADNAMLDAITARVPLDVLQLQGKESPERVVEVKARYGLPVMKAIGVGGPEDLATLDAFEEVADQILLDTKPPKGAARPGGNGVSFDWRLISARQWAKPWMLAGGLTVDNVHEAIALTGARQVDVSSSVESSPGQKDPDLMRAFVAAAMQT